MGIVRVVYKPDKSISIMRLALKTKHTPEVAYARMVKESHLEGLPYDDMDESKLPKKIISDVKTSNRGAWEGEKGKGVWVNEEKNKKIYDDKVKMCFDLRQAGEAAEEKAIKEGKLPSYKKRMLDTLGIEEKHLDKLKEEK